jgi:hypothetical protein
VSIYTDKTLIRAFLEMMRRFACFGLEMIKQHNLFPNAFAAISGKEISSDYKEIKGILILLYFCIMEAEPSKKPV